MKENLSEGESRFSLLAFSLFGTRADSGTLSDLIQSCCRRRCPCSIDSLSDFLVRAYFASYGGSTRFQRCEHIRQPPHRTIRYLRSQLYGPRRDDNFPPPRRKTRSSSVRSRTQDVGSCFHHRKLYRHGLLERCHYGVPSFRVDAVSRKSSSRRRGS